MDLAKYRQVFIEESTEHLAEMSSALLELEKDFADGEAIDLIFRMAHSIKGMAASLEFDSITQVSHALEDRMQEIRQAGCVADFEELAVLFRGLERLESMVATIRETDETPNVYRDSDQYYFTIFGNPSPDGTWGYRVEGFHLSLNVTIVKGRWISVTPSFFGAIPATVPDGPRKGLQVLKNETELGRALAKSFNAEQRKIGFGEIPDFLTETVGGLTTGNRRRIERGKPRGVAASAMTLPQREILMKLVREHIGRIRKELADQDLARIDCAGVEKIHFIWAGSLEPGEPHHYLIQGPTFLIEYDNTQDDANHVHCVYRDFDNDFGDAMLEHYRKHHHHGHSH